MQFSILLTTSLFFLAASASKNPRTSSVELQKRADVLVACESGTFQNPDEDIKNVVCKAEARCQSGSQATLETDPTTGKTYSVAQCTGCPTQVGELTSRCTYIKSIPGAKSGVPTVDGTIMEGTIVERSTVDKTTIVGEDQ